MKKTSIGFHKSPHSLKNAVDLLYSTSFNYQVAPVKENKLNPKQELKYDFSLMRYDSEQYNEQLKLSLSKQCSIKVIQGRSKEDGKSLSIYSPQSSEKSLDSPNIEFQQTKKLQFFNPIKQTSFGYQTQVESQFGKTVKKLTNIVNLAAMGSKQKRNIFTSIDIIKDRSFDKDNQSNISKSYVGKKQKVSSPLSRTSNSINTQLIPNSNYATKSNFYEKGQGSQMNSQFLSQKSQEGTTSNDPISKVQEVLLNIQNEEQVNNFGKKKKNKKRLFLGTTDKRKNQLQLSSKVSLDNNIISSTSLKDNEEDGVHNFLNTQHIIAMKDKQTVKSQPRQQQTLNLEGFRLQRSFSDEEQQINQSEKEIQQTRNTNESNNFGLNKKNTMIDLLDKAYNSNNGNTSNFPTNMYLEPYQRLGMEEWKTSKLKIGEFLWNRKIDQLKASIKKKMPAYSTTLLKQWQDFDVEPTTYASKRNISSHKEYFSPNKFKTSFKFYSPSSDLTNPSKSVVTSSVIHQPAKLDKIIQDDNGIGKKLLKATSPHSTIKSNISNERNLLSTAQTENKINNVQKGNTQDGFKDLSRTISNHKSQDIKSYQSEFISTQKKISSRQNELKKMIMKIKDHQTSTKDQPIIPKQLIDMAKKQSQTSFFQLQDIGRQKKTFNFFEKTPQYSTQEEVDDLITLKKLKQRSNTYKTFRNHVRQYLTNQKDD